MIFIDNLKNKKGGGSFILFMFISLLSVALIVSSLDIYNFYNINTKVKNSINRSVKGAALQLDTDIQENGENLAAKGIFLINEYKAEETLYDVLSKNLGLKKDTFEPLEKSILKNSPEILEFEVLNDYKKMPYEYYSKTLDRNFLVKNPSVFCVLKFEVNSIFLKKEFIYGKLSSAQLINIAK